MAASSVGAQAPASAPVGATVSPARTNPPNRDQQHSESFSFAFRDADVSQVASEILGSALGISYTVDPAITGKMSFRIDQRLTKAQLLEAFEAALAANDIALIRKGDALLLAPRSKARGAAGISSPDQGIRRAGYEVLAVPLSYASPTEIAKALDALAPANTVLFSSDKLGLIILGGSGKELDSALQTIKVFDQSGLQGTKIRWFELSRAEASTVAEELGRVLDGAGVSGVSLVPLKRLNGLVVFARTPQALEQVSDWINRLDVPSREAASSLFVYHPQSLTAEALGRVISSVMSTGGVMGDSGAAIPPKQGDNLAPNPQDPGAGVSGQGSAVSAAKPVGVPAPGSSSATAEGSVRIGMDRESNTLLISASAGQRVQIERVLREIDRPPKQVLIEASIIEVTLTNDMKSGVDWSFLTDGGKLSISSVNNGSGAIGSSYPGFSVAYLAGDIKAAVSALGARSDIQIVSEPKIITMDNHAAKLQVGDQVPIVTQSAQSTTTGDAPLVSTVNYRSTGVILDVTPRVSGDNSIAMDIAQEVSSVSSTSTSGIDSPTIKQRRMESSLSLADGGTVALGGLISTSFTDSDSGIPYLKNIPGVGLLFKSKTHNRDRTELIVLMRAKIIDGPASFQSTAAQLLADMHEISVRGLVQTVR